MAEIIKFSSNRLLGVDSMASVVVAKGEVVLVEEHQFFRVNVHFGLLGWWYNGIGHATCKRLCVFRGEKRGLPLICNLLGFECGKTVYSIVCLLSIRAN